MSVPLAQYNGEEFQDVQAEDEHNVEEYDNEHSQDVETDDEHNEEEYDDGHSQDVETDDEHNEEEYDEGHGQDVETDDEHNEEEYDDEHSQDEFGEMKNELLALQEDYEAMEKHLEDALDLLADITTSRKNLEAVNAELTRANEAFQRENAMLKTDNDSRTVNLDALNEITAAKQGLETDVRRLTRSKHLAQKESVGLRKELQLLKEGGRTLQEKYTDATKALESVAMLLEGLDILKTEVRDM